MAKPALYNFSHAKAGMDGVDKAHVAAVVHDMSKDSDYYKNALRHDARHQAHVAEMKATLAAASEREKAAGRAAAAAATAALEAGRELSRVWVVVDLDMFFAAVEMRDRPELRDVPMAVGGVGMLSTSNYAARKFGVRAAMPGFIAQKLCPSLVIVPPRYAAYKAAAKRVRGVFARYDPDFRAASLDEAFLDITAHCVAVGAIPPAAATASASQPASPQAPPRLATTSMAGAFHPRPLPAAEGGELEAMGGAGDRDDSVGGVGGGALNACRAAIEGVVAQMRAEITAATGGLTASAGIGPNPMLAKIASDVNKPDGQCFVPFSRPGVLAFMAPLPVRRVPFVGKVTQSILAGALGVHSVADLLAALPDAWLALSELQRTFLLRSSLGIADGGKEEGVAHRRKSVSQERTFRDCASLPALRARVRELAGAVAGMMTKGDSLGGPSWEFFGSSDGPPTEDAAQGDGGNGEEEGDEEGGGAPRVPYKGRTLTLKLKLANFKVLQRQVALPRATDSVDAMAAAGVALLEKEAAKAEAAREAAAAAGAALPPPLTLRLMGLRMSNLVFQDDIENSAMTKFLAQGAAAPPAPVGGSKRPRAAAAVPLPAQAAPKAARFFTPQRSKAAPLPCPVGVQPSTWRALPREVQAEVHASMSGGRGLAALSGGRR